MAKENIKLSKEDKRSSAAKAWCEELSTDCEEQDGEPPLAGTMHLDTASPAASSAVSVDGRSADNV